jgi:hypothetical protein
MWRCGCARENREMSFLYTVLTVDARRGSGSDRIFGLWLKTTERRRTISTFYTQRNSKSPANKAEKSGLVAVLDAEADKSSRVKQGPVNASGRGGGCQCDDTIESTGCLARLGHWHCHIDPPNPRQ